MITRVRETELQRQERIIGEWAKELDAARLAGKWSSRLQSLEEQVEAHFANQEEWDEEELAYMRAREQHLSQMLA